MSERFTESVVRSAALTGLTTVGWHIVHGPDIAPAMPAAECGGYGQQVVGVRRLGDTLTRLNPALPAEALDDAFRPLTIPEGAERVAGNRALHSLLIEGVTSSVAPSTAARPITKAMPQLNRLTIRGFKSIRALEDFELRGLNVLIGANGAWKSNFISLFRMLAELIEKRLQLFVKEQDGPDALLFGGRQRTKSLEAEFIFGSNGYKPDSADLRASARHCLILLEP